MTMNSPYQVPPGAPSPYRPLPTAYEFTEPENAVVRGLATTTRVVGVINLVSVVVAGANLLVSLARPNLHPVPRMGAQGVAAIGFAGFGVAAVFGLLVAFWMFRSSAAFTRVVETQGNDVPNLIEALGYQRSYFRMLKVLTLVLFSLVVGACVIGCFGAMLFSRRGG